MVSIFEPESDGKALEDASKTSLQEFCKRLTDLREEALT